MFPSGDCQTANNHKDTSLKLYEFSPPVPQICSHESFTQNTIADCTKSGFLRHCVYILIVEFMITGGIKCILVTKYSVLEFQRGERRSQM